MVAFSDDAALAARVRACDPVALQSVIEAYLKQILRAARGAGLSPERAEDVAQATFTTFLEKAQNFEGRSQVRTWVFGILYRKIAEARRAVQKEHSHDDIDEVMEQRFDSSGSWLVPPRPIESGVHGSQIRDKIEDCMAGLSDKQRLAFVLREVEGFSTTEICKILEISRTNLGIILFRGRNRLRECLEAKGVSGSHDANV